MIKLEGWEKWNQLMSWVVKLVYLNILWIGFTMAGLIVFGLFPATGSMFFIILKWLNKEPVEKVFHTFWFIYKREFLKLNKFGILFYIVIYIFIYDLLFLQINSGKLLFIFPVLVFLLICFLLTFLYFFPVYLQFDLKFYQYMKQSFFVAASSLLETMMILASCMVLTIIIRFIPGIIPFYSGSIIALIVSWCSLRALEKINQRKKDSNNI